RAPDRRTPRRAHLVRRAARRHHRQLHRPRPTALRHHMSSDPDHLRSGALVVRRGRRPGTVGGRFARRMDVLLVEDDAAYATMLAAQMRQAWGETFGVRRCATLAEAISAVHD